MLIISNTFVSDVNYGNEIIHLSNPENFNQIADVESDSTELLKTNTLPELEESQFINSDSPLSNDNSLSMLKTYFQYIQSRSSSLAVYEGLIKSDHLQMNNLKNNSEAILLHWKKLRENGLMKNPIRQGNEPNTSGIPLGNWWGFYAGLKQPPSDTIWGLSRMSLDSLKRIKSISDSINKIE